jgi:hypothetical protein
MYEKLKTVLYNVLFVVIVSALFSGAIFFYTNRSGTSNEVNAELAEYNRIQLEQYSRIEQSLERISGIEDQIESIRGSVEGIEARLQSSKDWTTGIGITSDENIRIIRELQRRADERAKEQ